jgi:hypothetical protein
VTREKLRVVEGEQLSQIRRKAQGGELIKRVIFKDVLIPRLRGKRVVFDRCATVQDNPRVIKVK